MKQHTAVLGSSVFLIVEASALLDPLNFKQLHVCVIPDRGIHIPERERQKPLNSVARYVESKSHSPHDRS